MRIGPELGIFLEPLVLQEKEFISLAVNDNASTDTAGGSHWYVETQRFFSVRTFNGLLVCFCFVCSQCATMFRSALVYVREENSFYHLDSWTPTNNSPAKACARKITPFLRGIYASITYDTELRVQIRFPSLLSFFESILS